MHHHRASWRGFVPRHRFAVAAAVILSALLTGPFLAACNTMEGFGKDMSHAGSAISNSAEENK